jgi:hypothetical protein
VAQLPELIGEIPIDTNYGLSFGMKIIPMGDVNDDGFDDIIISRLYHDFFLYYGSDPIDTIPDLHWDSVSYNVTNVGDINGDGYDDIVSWDMRRVKFCAWYGGPSIDIVPDLCFGEDSVAATAPCALGDDINQDGTNELIARNWNSKSLPFYDLGPGVDSVFDVLLFPANVDPQWHRFGDGLAVGDFNGDGKRDLAANVRPDPLLELSGSVYLYWGGADFDTIPELIIPHPTGYQLGSDAFGWLLVNIGDVNADGADDLLANSDASENDTVSFVFFGGSDMDAVPDLIIPDKLKYAHPAGDLNTDGFDDFIVSYPLPWSGMGVVRVYYGGPDVDSIPDVVITNGEMPGYQTYFGRDCAGIGDFNGDGIEDFAISATSSWWGAVYIFSGVDQGVGVEFEYEPTLPADFSLLQNYPNPFNPSTTIEFQLPERTTVTLTVSNILGQHVVVLVERTLPAGTHKIIWDGMDDKDHPMPSGVYLYDIKADNHRLSRKMLLLK